jgi:SAM-dependent methyltransferase
MDPRHLDELKALEDHYWWHVSKRALVTGLLETHAPPPGRLVEGGVGGGGNLRHFRSLGYRVTGLEVMPEAVRHCEAQGLSDVHVHDLETPWPIDEAADVVVLLDVLEHADRPVLVLENANAVLVPNGVVVLTVPAVPALYGPWDEVLGHRRRYTRSSLREDARAAGFAIEFLSYWNSFTFPAAVGIRAWEKRSGRARSSEFPRISRPLNEMLKGMATVERRLMDLGPIPVGLSLCAVMRRAA